MLCDPDLVLLLLLVITPVIGLIRSYHYNVYTNGTIGLVISVASVFSSEVSHGCSAFAILDHQFLEGECI